MSALSIENSLSNPAERTRSYTDLNTVTSHSTEERSYAKLIGGKGVKGGRGKAVQGSEAAADLWF
jgi:hypothetical protein